MLEGETCTRCAPSTSVVVVHIRRQDVASWQYRTSRLDRGTLLVLSTCAFVCVPQNRTAASKAPIDMPAALRADPSCCQFSHRPEAPIPVHAHSWSGGDDACTHTERGRPQSWWRPDHGRPRDWQVFGGASTSRHLAAVSCTCAAHLRYALPDYLLSGR
jgi:hypothetical protein